MEKEESRMKQMMELQYFTKFPNYFLLACKPAYGWHMLGCQPTDPKKALQAYTENFVTYKQTHPHFIYYIY